MVSTIFSDQILQTSSATITTWLPLSTAWPSTAACSTLVYVGTGKEAGKVFGWDPLYQAVLDTGSPRCFADEMASWWLESTSTTISLGPMFNCPATSVHSAGVTQVLCCPTDYKLSVLIPSHSHGDYPTQCMSTLTSGDILKYQTPIGGIYQPTSMTVSETLLVHGEHINGWNIHDTVFASMMGSTQTASNTTSITSTLTTSSSTNGVYTTTMEAWGGTITTETLESATGSTSFSTGSTSPSSSSSTSTTSTQSSTSITLAAGVGVAAAVVVLGIAAAIFLLLRRRRKSVNIKEITVKEIDSAEVYPYTPSFSHAQPSSELSVEFPPGELNGETDPNVYKKDYYPPSQRLYEI